MSLSERINTTDKKGSAIRYQNPKSKSLFSGSRGRKLYIEPDALTYIKSLNDYDQAKVCKSIEEIAAVPSPMNGAVHKQHPNFFKAKRAKASKSNFFVKYTIVSDSVIITSIRLNTDVLGQQDKSKDERAALYDIKKQIDLKFTTQSTLNQVGDLANAWKVGSAKTKVNTEWAAVNGMLNDLRKAAWLMGVHAEHAYPKDKINQYTLFHNPTISGLPDFYECARDNMGITTENAKQLAAVLKDVQLTGKSVKWVVHSQGGIIFKQALAHHVKHNPGVQLDKNSVVFHSGGNNKKATEKLLAQTGIKKAGPDKDNPFDLVPNLAGGNDLKSSTIGRSLKFWQKVKGTPTSSSVESPHTLPFISLEVYHQFLMMAGDNKSADRVKKHMNKLAY